MEKKQENDDYSFMQEQIKKRPINKKKLLKRTFTTGAMAIMFGIVASLAFILLEPVFTKLVSPKEESLRRMSLYWGVTPLKGENKASTDALIEASLKNALDAGLIKKGDSLVVTAGMNANVRKAGLPGG